MKKTALLIAALAMCSAIQAREFTFKFNGQTVEDGATLYFNDPEEVFTGAEYEVLYAPSITVQSDGLTQTAKMTVTSVSGQTVSCCAGGNCVRGTNIVKDLPRISANQAVPLELEYSTVVASLADVPQVEVKVEIVDTKVAGSNKSFTIFFNKDEASVGNVMADGSTVTFSNNTLSYTVSEAARLTVCTTAGVIAYSAEVKGAGSIDLSQLPAGIYVYTLANQSGKIQVK